MRYYFSSSMQAAGVDGERDSERTVLKFKCSNIPCILVMF